jgi:thioredoxin reductase
MSREQVITRHPRDYTVQIRHTTTNTLVGTGIVVSSEKIVTCAHVVVAAGVNPRLGRRIPGQWEMVLQSVFGRKAESLMEVRDAEVGVYFPE